MPIRGKIIAMPQLEGKRIIIRECEGMYLAYENESIQPIASGSDQITLLGIVITKYKKASPDEIKEINEYIDNLKKIPS